MNDIFSKDLSGEMVSPDEPGYDLLITINHDPDPDNRNATYGRPIVIEDKVWIGINSTVCPA